MARENTRSLTPSVAALVGAGLHALIPRLIDLPQRTSGAGLGPSLSTPGFTTIAALAAAGAVVSLGLRRVGGLVVGAAALTSTFIVLWEFSLLVWPLALTLLVPAWRLIASDDAKTIDHDGRRAAIASIAVGAAIVWFAALRPWRAEFTATHPESDADPKP